MIELYSCRNCIHDAGQSMHLGPGQGFCIKHSSVISNPSDTTCKYLHRKDLASFVVDEGRSEHAAEFAAFSGLVSLSEKKHLPRVNYSEKYCWERRQFDPIVNSLASYYKSGKSWVFIQSFAGGVDGRRRLVHSCLSRRYMDRCVSWSSSYRMVLSLVQEMQDTPLFSSRVLLMDNGDPEDEVREQARWDVFFTQLSGIQEYGFHSGIEELMWASDSVNGGLSDLDWQALERELSSACPAWIDKIIKHAEENDAFFSQPAEEYDDSF
ncbi:MAG: hypothetical protein JXR96_22985 [Deltaproteobacteria bacterium]|nr:hypothetical protein [Deltaproteobacteria bacterium]